MPSQRDIGHVFKPKKLKGRLNDWRVSGLRSSWSHQLTVLQRVDQLSVLAGEDGACQVEHYTHS